MCGIIGVAGNLTSTDESIFRELLLADVVRGRHATGIAQVKGKADKVTTFKLAMPSTFFLELPIVNDILKGFINNTVALGHNRHATKGASDSHEYAHPFTHGHITLVHNGSLTSHFNITPKGESYIVDSEAICRAFEVEGAAEVIPKLNGAFALVWIDAKEKTLNFVRNSERRLGLVFNSKTNKMWWASELELVLWSLKRGDDLFSRSVTPYDNAMELQAGKWVKVPITATGIDLSGMSITDIKVHEPYTYKAGSYTYPKAGNTTTKTKEDTEESLKKAVEVVISERGRTNQVVRAFVSRLDANPEMLDLGSRIVVKEAQFIPYAASYADYGVVRGVTAEKPFCRIEIHSMTKKEYEATLATYTEGFTAYLVGFVTPAVLDSNIKLKDFGIILNKNTIKKLNTISVGMSVLYSGEHTKVLKNYRYTVAEVKSNIITLRIGSELYDVSREDCSDPKDLKLPRVFTGPGVDSLYTIEEWKSAVSCGCSACKQVVSDPQEHVSIEWFDDGSYLCGACWFEQVSAGV